MVATSYSIYSIIQELRTEIVILLTAWVAHVKQREEVMVVVGGLGGKGRPVCVHGGGGGGEGHVFI